MKCKALRRIFVRKLINHQWNQWVYDVRCSVCDGETRSGPDPGVTKASMLLPLLAVPCAIASRWRRMTPAMVARSASVISTRAAGALFIGLCGRDAALGAVTPCWRANRPRLRISLSIGVSWARHPAIKSLSGFGLARSSSICCRSRVRSLSNCHCAEFSRLGARPPPLLGLTSEGFPLWGVFWPGWSGCRLGGVSGPSTSSGVVWDGVSFGPGSQSAIGRIFRIEVLPFRNSRLRILNPTMVLMQRFAVFGSILQTRAMFGMDS